MSYPFVSVIGAGLAGVEASIQLANRGINVKLYEMKKITKSPAHQLDTFAELVCSNSFRSNSIENACGLLKAELRLLNSAVIQAADVNQVPAGSALAVDRDLFSEYLTKEIYNNPLIEVIDEEIKNIPEGFVIIATGPLTANPLFESIKKLTGEDSLYFYDAAAPIIEFDSINMEKAYFKSRYDKGEATYINCPMTKDEYDSWYEEVLHANCVIPKDFELKVFEGCMPFEEIARRGYNTLLYGPMKPVGLRKLDGTRPYAVVQLRQDNVSASLYNIVGFQTHLTFSEQLRIIRLIPGLENARIVRYGVMHKNTFINAPKILNRYYQIKNHPKIFIAGQLSGVEGYVESIGSGMIAGINMAKLVKEKDLVSFPRMTALGAQAFYLENAEPLYFQPMNVNFGIFPPFEEKHNKKQRKELMANRSIEALKQMLEVNLFE
ncbi:MAG: methylenetetrahydrofolate--tRNA-(uracil(54)-C(5))-methyltransferase (FADH(2)-oxidizing) TrmFO [Firmicutes bacterium]|nr:methylenetetrahydrofolate--tRNA-(uracil(54)-C(5))-methyltransferase (FADH(2)-oxidizing) TrmFO [Bacillota bacterium]